MIFWYCLQTKTHAAYLRSLSKKSDKVPASSGDKEKEALKQAPENKRLIQAEKAETGGVYICKNKCYCFTFNIAALPSVGNSQLPWRI